MTEKELTQKIYMRLLKHHINGHLQNYLISTEKCHELLANAKMQAKILTSSI